MLDTPRALDARPPYLTWLGPAELKGQLAQGVLTLAEVSSRDSRRLLEAADAVLGNVESWRYSCRSTVSETTHAVLVTLTAEEDVTLQVYKDQTTDGRALTGVLDTERHEEWTGDAVSAIATPTLPRRSPLNARRSAG